MNTREHGSMQGQKLLWLSSVFIGGEYFFAFFSASWASLQLDVFGVTCRRGLGNWMSLISSSTVRAVELVERGFDGEVDRGAGLEVVDIGPSRRRCT